MIKNYILILLALISSSCSDWLDVLPIDEASAEKLLEEERGFRQTLNGSYIMLSEVDAYGKELTIGFTEEIVHNWIERSEFFNFKYEDSNVESRLNKTWSSLYKAIANTNIVINGLESIDESKFVDYKLIKGEALGLRAYLHLDLLRIFGPIINGNTNQLSIPYHKNFDNEIIKRMSVKDVFSYIEKDLIDAYNLLSDDPVKVNGIKNDYAEKDLMFSDYRGLRMNYYAVCATLARFYMLKNDKVNAFKYANEIIERDDLFLLLQRSDIISANRDCLFSRELIWSVFDQNMEKNISDPLARGSYSVEPEYRNVVYEHEKSYGSYSDYRRSFWWKTVSLSKTFETLCKYQRQKDMNAEDITVWTTLVPMIKLSEIYYIAAETQLTDNTELSYNLINKVRLSRGLTVLPETIKNDATELMKQIVYEYQKDFWGEGKLFYLYKRLNHDIIIKDGVINASSKIYELPIPMNEIEFAGNN